MQYEFSIQPSSRGLTPSAADTFCTSRTSVFSHHAQRELVIDRLLALDAKEIDVEQVKWVVLMVLFSQPGQEKAFARMEDLVFDGWLDAVH